VDDAPYFVRALRLEGDGVTLLLSDETEEPWDPSATDISSGGALYTSVKAAAKGGPFRAKFTRHAQSSLAPVLTDDGGVPAARLHGLVVRIGGPC
jgi:hypothetical protein